MFHDLNKSQNFTPGIMCTLHTFGRDLKWNPHIHMLCTEGVAVNYVVRYTRRPAMPRSRIPHYDDSFVTFWYQRHEDNSYVE